MAKAEREERMHGLIAEALAARAPLAGADVGRAEWPAAAGNLDRMLDLPAGLFMARRPPPRPPAPPPRQRRSARS